MALDKEDRDEIRAMMHDVIDPWQKESAKADTLINIALNNIDGHLDKLNSKVAEHEKIININLPHTVQHCPNVELIKTIEQEQLTWKRLRGVVVTTISAIGGILASIWIIYKLFIENGN